jgi:hypothetical protein
VRRLPPEPVFTITPGDYLDWKSKRDYEMQKRAAETRMEQFDAAPREFRRVWDAVADGNMAAYLWDRGVRDFDTAERVKRAMVRRVVR